MAIERLTYERYRAGIRLGIMTGRILISEDFRHDKFGSATDSIGHSLLYTKNTRALEQHEIAILRELFRINSRPAVFESGPGLGRALTQISELASKRNVMPSISVNSLTPLNPSMRLLKTCLLYTSDAADE